ncbi:MAG: CvpA family protein [Clostridia bacterium]|nr:CvpA family protein [Clostridia bacterium]
MLLNAVSFDTNMLIGLAIDVLLVATLLLFAVVGAKKGIVKMSLGLITAVAVLGLSIWLVSPVSKLIIDGTKLDNQLMSALEQPIGAKLPGSYTTLFYDDYDNDPETPDQLLCDKDGTAMPYEYIFEGTVYEKFNLHKLIKPMIEDALQNEEVDHIYLVDAITFSISSIIIMAGTFIVLLILLRIIMAILMKLLRKAISSLYVAHFLDKLLGFAFGLAMGAVIVVVVVTLVQIMQNMTFMEPVMTAIDRSYLTKFVMQNNFIYTYIVEKINLQNILTKLFPGSQS